MDNLIIRADDDLTAADVVRIRSASGWDADSKEWEKCLPQNLVNVSARDQEDRVVGVGFLTGNIRHAQITDLVVMPEFREHHVATQILEELIKLAHKSNVKYLSLTYDKNYPWLKDFYERHGFEAIDFAMWHKDSLGGHA